MISPHLKSTQLRNRIFHVVERDAEEMRLSHPTVCSDFFDASPVHLTRSKAVHDTEPGLATFIAGVPRSRVEPVLE